MSARIIATYQKARTTWEATSRVALPVAKAAFASRLSTKRSTLAFELGTVVRASEAANNSKSKMGAVLCFRASPRNYAGAWRWKETTSVWASRTAAKCPGADASEYTIRIARVAAEVDYLSPEACAQGCRPLLFERVGHVERTRLAALAYSAGFSRSQSGGWLSASWPTLAYSVFQPVPLLGCYGHKFLPS